MASVEERLRIWNKMTPEERDYDRFIAGQIPQGANWAPETTWGRREGRSRLAEMVGDCGGCSCHRNPPCAHCEGNHRNHEHDDGHGPDPWELEVAEIEAHEEAELYAAEASRRAVCASGAVR